MSLEYSYQINKHAQEDPPNCHFSIIVVQAVIIFIIPSPVYALLYLSINYTPALEHVELPLDTIKAFYNYRRTCTVNICSSACISLLNKMYMYSCDIDCINDLAASSLVSAVTSHNAIEAFEISRNL